MLLQQQFCIDQQYFNPALPDYILFAREFLAFRWAIFCRGQGEKTPL